MIFAPHAQLSPVDIFNVVNIDFSTVNRWTRYSKLWKLLRDCKVPIITGSSGHKTVIYSDLVDAGLVTVKV